MDAVADESLRTRIDQAVARAWKRHEQWCPDVQPSYLKSHEFRHDALQSLGQTATRTGRDKIGDVDWRPWTTQLWRSEQQADSGRWNGDPGFGTAQPLIYTSLAVLFLTEK